MSWIGGVNRIEIFVALQDHDPCERNLRGAGPLKLKEKKNCRSLDGVLLPCCFVMNSTEANFTCGNK